MLKYEEYPPEIKNSSLWNFYLSFIISLKKRKCPENTYVERHHIIPKNYIPKEFWKDKENIIILTGSEHFIVHYILYLVFKDYAMTCAIKKMAESRGQNGKIEWLTPKQYEEVRRNWTKLHSKKIKGRSNPKLKEYYAIHGGTNLGNHWIHRILEDGSVERRQQDKSLPCPEGWKFGSGPSVPCSDEKKRAISETHKKSGYVPKNKNTRGIHRILGDGTIERDYIPKGSLLPEGWLETTGPHGAMNVKDKKERIYIFQYNKNKKIVRYIHEGDSLPEGWSLLNEEDKMLFENQKYKRRTLF